MSDVATSQGRDEPPGLRTGEGERAARAPVSRGEGARDRVLRAALELLADHGYSGFTMEAVAHRAQASKATVYRRWTCRAELLVDAMERVSQPLSLPETGDLRTDLVALVSDLQDRLTHQPFPRLLAAFVDAAERDPTLSAVHAELTERRREPLRRVLARACRRGEIPSSTDLDLAVDLLGAPAFYRRLIGHQGFPDGYASAVVDHVLTAIGHSTADRPDHR